MAKKRKPDIVMKNYWREGERFADLYNAVLFQGRGVIHPEDLEEMDTDVSDILEKKGFIKNFTSARDVVKLLKYSKQYQIALAILGLENQDKIHYAMPLRIMDYDVLSYKRQYKENARKYKKKEELSEEEFLSRMKKTDKFIPVITIVVYYGEKEWDGARTLKEMLDIPEQFDVYVNDYRMNLVELRKNDLPLKNQQNKDLFQICQILHNGAQSIAERKGQIIDYIKKHKVDREVIIAASAASGRIIEGEKEEWGMYSFWTEWEREYKEIGEKIGKEIGAANQIIEMGEEFGLTENDILQRLQNKLGWNLKRAKEYYSTYKKQKILV